MLKLHRFDHGKPAPSNPTVPSATLPRPQGPPAAPVPRGLGDRVEAMVKPAAKLLQRAGLMNCLDCQGKLHPASPCAQRRERLNQLGKKLGL